jgi:hypothetical protein
MPVAGLGHAVAGWLQSGLSAFCMRRLSGRSNGL